MMQTTETELKCDGCHKPLSELKPYGGPGDPLVGDFNGQKLVQLYAPLYNGPQIDEHEKILNEYKHYESTGTDNIKELEEKYGFEAVDRAFFYDQMRCTVEKQLLCRDCAIK